MTPPENLVDARHGSKIRGIRGITSMFYRVYCQMKINLPRRAKRRVPQRTRQPLWVGPEMNVVWALDFMRDTLYGGRVFSNFERDRRGQPAAVWVSTSPPASRRCG